MSLNVKSSNAPLWSERLCLKLTCLSLAFACSVLRQITEPRHTPGGCSAAVSDLWPLSERRERGRGICPTVAQQIRQTTSGYRPSHKWTLSGCLQINERNRNWCQFTATVLKETAVSALTSVVTAATFQKTAASRAPSGIRQKLATFMLLPLPDSRFCRCPAVFRHFIDRRMRSGYFPQMLLSHMWQTAENGPLQACSHYSTCHVFRKVSACLLNQTVGYRDAHSTTFI